jgi:voltage-gated potassium channel Kch
LNTSQAQNVFNTIEKSVLVLLALLSFYLGVIGYKTYFELAATETTLSDLAYLSLNLFFLQFEASGPLPIPLDIARWVAPATLSYALIKTIMTLVHSKLLQFKIRRLTNHAIIIGLNDRSVNIALSFQQNGIKTLVIDNEEDNQYWGELKENKILYLVANLSDRSLLDNIKLAKATYLFATSASDNINLSIIYDTFCAKQKMPDRPVLQTVCKIEDNSLLHALNDRHLFAVDHHNMSTRTLNYKLMLARWMVNEFGPHMYISDFSNLNGITILIAGANAFTPELVVRLAEIGVYTFANGNLQKLHIILLGTSAKQIYAEVVTTYPSIIDFATIETIASDAFEEAHYQDVISNSAAHIIYVCPVETGEKLLMLQRFIHLDQSVPVVVCETDNQRAFEWLKSEFTEKNNVKFVNINSAISHYEDVFENRLDRIAIVIHNNYVTKGIASGESVEQNPSLVTWNDLPESLKNANRSQADHIAIKCHYLTGNTRATKKEIDGTLNTNTKTALAKMEHKRWVAQKKLGGWQYTSGNKDAVKKLSPSLIDWHELCEQEKQKDIDAVEHLPELLELINTKKDYLL